MGKPLDRKTVQRLCEEWQRRSGKGKMFGLYAKVWQDPEGRKRDVISVVEDPGTPAQKISAIFDYEM